MRLALQVVKTKPMRPSLPCALRSGTNLLVLLLALYAASFQARCERTTISLDGKWQIADSLEAEVIPATFPGAVQVPGLANLAKPAFDKVDAFYSREHLANRIRSKLAPEEWLTNYWKGKVEQDRNYFWYRKTFRAPARRAVALLKINKAQFGTAVWLNGQKLGEYAGCFTASYFHLEQRHPLERGEHAGHPHRRAPGRAAGHLPDRLGLREDQVDARHLRQRVADLLRQPGYRDHPGGAAHRHRRNRGADQVEELRRVAAVDAVWSTRSRPGRAEKEPASADAAN